MQFSSSETHSISQRSQKKTFRCNEREDRLRTLSICDTHRYYIRSNIRSRSTIVLASYRTCFTTPVPEDGCGLTADATPEGGYIVLQYQIIPLKTIKHQIHSVLKVIRDV